ncbi:MAG: peptidase S24 [Flavobacteriaceae bacterium]|nr:peptidase S24 [Flavobacteriaceae bacterium]|tara:strand:+ start:6765 stop:7190 length:426 start_codon:yes stop_codon:yes gene_type:complete
MKKLKFFGAETEKNRYLSITSEGISAGFPSPADDFKESKISIDQEVVKNESATFYARVVGQSMQGAGLDDGDLIVIDRSQEPDDGKIAVCYIDGEFTVKRLKVENQCVYLMPENKKYKALKVTEENQLIIWGVVTYVVKKV